MMSEEAIKQIEKVWRELGTEHILTSFELGVIPLLAQLYKDPSEQGNIILHELSIINQKIHKYVFERYLVDEMDKVLDDLGESEQG